MASNILEDTVKFLIDYEDGGRVVCNKAPPTIYMVPSVIRDLSPSSFTPRVVAIGPLHRQDEHLQAFEEVQKTGYLHNLLHRLDLVPEQTLRKCAEQVILSVERIKACYAGSTTYDDLELAKMMVIDACFILEFIQTLWDSSSRTNILISRSITEDLLLLENQIPFFVLEVIFESTFVASGLLREGASVTNHMKVLLNYFYLFDAKLVVPRASTPDHILGFLHQYFQPVQPLPPVSVSSIKRHTAMELDRAGMNFKPYEDENWGLAMKLELPIPWFPWFHIFMAIPPFSWFRRPTLRMPIVYINDYIELIFRNLVVYEQSPDVEKYVTAYLVAMDMLIDTPEDVALLVKAKVLQNDFGSNQEALLSVFYKIIQAFGEVAWPISFGGITSRSSSFSNSFSVATSCNYHVGHVYMVLKCMKMWLLVLFTSCHNGKKEALLLP